MRRHAGARSVRLPVGLNRYSVAAVARHSSDGSARSAAGSVDLAGRVVFPAGSAGSTSLVGRAGGRQMSAADSYVQVRDASTAHRCQERKGPDAVSASTLGEVVHALAFIAGSCRSVYYIPICFFTTTLSVPSSGYSQAELPKLVCSRPSPAPKLLIPRCIRTHLDKYSYPAASVSTGAFLPPTANSAQNYSAAHEENYQAERDAFIKRRPLVPTLHLLQVPGRSTAPQLEGAYKYYQPAAPLLHAWENPAHSKH
ncbi:hypothetical protein RJ55_02777 [Drechmeria coniospora]|nr:hypothetical protein RJ55_02777 [Drechmeria coniospora]